MVKTPSIFCQRNETPSGFALVIALTLVSFFLLITIALISITRVESKVADASNAQIEARQNAVTAAKMAIGQLQQLTGSDTRITASSKVLDDNNVPLTGVWRSWEASDRDASNYGKPIAPNYDAKRRPGDPTQATETNWSDGRFLGWLTSVNGLPNDTSGVTAGSEIAHTPGNNQIPMVAGGSIDISTNPLEAVYITPTALQRNGTTTGSIAWWTSGDNAKAQINTDPEPDTSNFQFEDWQQRTRSNGRPDPTLFGLSRIDDDFNTPRIPSDDMLNLFYDTSIPADDRLKFHDITTFSRGLLTNTAVGGWRKDLSLMTESFVSTSDAGEHSTTTSLPSFELPFYTSEPGKILTARKGDGETSGTIGALVYPWSDYRYGSAPKSHTGPIASWSHLVDYAMAYRDISIEGGVPSYGIIDNEDWPQIDGGSASTSYARDNFSNKIRVSPILGRLQLIFGISSVQELDNSDIPTGNYVPALTLSPAFTVWNPYNVEITIPANMRPTIRLRKQIASARIHINTITNSGNGFSNSLDDIFSNNFEFATPQQTLTLLPGETRIFGLDPAYGPIIEGTSTVDLVEGYDPSVSIRYMMDTNKSYAASETIIVERVTFDKQFNFNGGAQDGIGIRIEYNAGTANQSRARYNMQLADSVFSANTEYYPPIESINLGGAVGSIISLPEEFMSLTFANRAVSPLSTDRIDPANAFNYQNSKAFLQGHPLTHHVNIGESFEAGSQPDTTGSGNYHPIHSPFDISLRAFSEDYRPNQPPSSNSSYILTGYFPDTGLTRAIVAEIPTRPIQSLVDLTHWDARDNNPVPPFQFNLLGNASASPIIQQTNVSAPGVPGSEYEDFANDDSYLLNHLFFDDWFVSSISPREFENVGLSTIRTSLSDTYRDHLFGNQSLPNRFYHPTSAAKSSDIITTTSDIVSGSKIDIESEGDVSKYPFEYIASKLEVEGMFNVNSTSVKAWEALLRQARNQQVAIIDQSGQIVLDSPSSGASPFPRTSIAGDQDSASNSMESSVSFMDAAEFAGYRTLSDTEIEDLALEIVRVIKERGPFLSLSEFVNRQLSNDPEDAIAGTIQKALDNLANGDHASGSNSSNPFATLEDHFIPLDEASTIPGEPLDYAFAEAAKGSPSFGTPGWIRQADILRPIAPLLSARDDTFTIRAYGDKRDPSASNSILAQAWCEIVLTRRAEYVDHKTDAPEALPFSNTEMVSSINETLGRNYEIVSFRWLSEEEI
ncbi:MAG: hypothetical protein ACPGN3_01350 [Opitutales bacterium]